MLLVNSFSPYAALATGSDWLDFPESSGSRGFSNLFQDTQLGRTDGSRGETLWGGTQPRPIGAGEPSTSVVPNYRNSEATALTSPAYVDNFKPDIFTFSITVSPDHQGLALPSLSFQSFLKFPRGKDQ